MKNCTDLEVRNKHNVPLLNYNGAIGCTKWKHLWINNYGIARGYDTRTTHDIKRKTRYQLT